MMERKEKIEVAKKISKNILKRYGKEIKAIAIYGSLAKKTDLEYSDIELFIVTKKDLSSKNKYLIYKNVPLMYWFITSKEIEEMLKNPKGEWPDWPQSVESFVKPLPLYDPENLFMRYKKIRSKIPPSTFKKACETTLINIYEEICKIKNAKLSNNKIAITDEARELGWITIMFVALANGFHYTSTKNRFAEALSLKKLPKDFGNLVSILMGYNPSTIEEKYNSCINLWDNIKDFSKENNYKIKTIKDLKSLKI